MSKWFSWFKPQPVEIGEGVYVIRKDTDVGHGFIAIYGLPNGRELSSCGSSPLKALQEVERLVLRHAAQS